MVTSDGPKQQTGGLRSERVTAAFTPSPYGLSVLSHAHTILTKMRKRKSRILKRIKTQTNGGETE